MYSNYDFENKLTFYNRELRTGWDSTRPCAHIALVHLHLEVGKKKTRPWHSIARQHTSWLSINALVWHNSEIFENSFWRKKISKPCITILVPSCMMIGVIIKVIGKCHEINDIWRLLKDRYIFICNKGTLLNLFFLVSYKCKTS